jgi:hypothetical protein
MQVLNSKFLGQTYYKFTLGWGIISIPVSLIGYLTFVKVWQPTFEFYHIPFLLVLTAFPILLLAVGFGIGHYMIKHRVQAEINSLINLQANPEVRMILEKVDIIIRNQEKGR